jgi:hypothetical protein
MAPLFTKTEVTFRTLVQYGLLLCFGVGFVLYVLFQARFLTAGPTLTLVENLPNPQLERVITLSGTQLGTSVKT